ncbi:large ribosomal subunit protein mL40-like [Meriones unguiculatus]|uniref:large ribosomal subunit protein mL40-like n=1 Tax=Meriones unguiculatus TaxID=10047 RepID=UPI000B4F6169|nr:large ribosomal subunit protein mL40-like [Meriones unguiculatus]
MLCAARALRPRSWAPGTYQTQMRLARRSASLLSWELIPTRAEPLQKKRKADPRKDQAAKDHSKKTSKKLGKATQELIPVEDFTIPVRLLDKSRQRPREGHSPEERERRVLLLKRWALSQQQELERDSIKATLEAQQEGLGELKLDSAELCAETVKWDPSLFPCEKEKPHYTSPVSNYRAPEGR